MLTEYLGWRWCFYINLPIALIVALAALRTLPSSPAQDRSSLDLLGAFLSVGGLAAVVYGLTVAGEGGAETHSVRAPVTLLAGTVLLLFFIFRQRHASNPLLPLSIPSDRTRATAFLSMALIGAGMFGMLMFLAFYLQTVLQFSPLATGLAFLPFSAGIVLGSSLASRLMPSLGDSQTMWIGVLGAAAGMIWLVPVGAGPGFWAQVLPALCVMSFGLGVYFVPASSSALTGVRNEESGVASALVNVTQQVGGSVGPALLNSVFLMATAASADTRLQTIEGYRAAFGVAAGLFLIALAITLVLPRRASRRTAD
ncbi:MFS transporter [Tranquillimonas rosea]|uniref:MFS transporter n=1 Tax=Tranquillimonas rosea TaxID=641238 RepID=UPI003BAC8F2D